MTAFPHDLGFSQRAVVYVPTADVAWLSLDGQARDLGNGWVDVTDRLVAATLGQWRPATIQGIEMMILTDRGVASDGRTPRPGALFRSPSGGYLMFDGNALAPCAFIDVDEDHARVKDPRWRTVGSGRRKNAAPPSALAPARDRAIVVTEIAS